MVFSATNAVDVISSVVVLSLGLSLAMFFGLFAATRYSRSGSAANRYLAWLGLSALCAALPVLGLAQAFAHRHFVAFNFQSTSQLDAHSPEFQVLPVFFTIWALGTLVLLIRLIVRLRIAVAFKRGERFDGSVRTARGAAIVLSDAVTSPVAIGYLHPAIVLPTLLADDDYATIREHALAHENAHLLRYDDITALLYQVCISLAWFNPIVWLIAPHLETEREKACDDAVVLQTRAAKAYGRSLLTLCGRGVFARPEHVLALFESPRRLADRIESLVTKRQRSLHPSTRATTACVAMLLAAFVLTGAYTPGFTLPTCFRHQAPQTRASVTMTVAYSRPPVTGRLHGRDCRRRHHARHSVSHSA